ncbi:MAG: hypothetical protein KIS94_14250 [Chitinophagales bacterium]|nr:hypothetical protein [Chitinophagales bacterium]
MKKIFKTFLAVAAFAAITGITSCTKVCDNGYEGDKCDVQWRTKFIGTYQFADVCPSGNYTGTATITVSANNVVTILLTNYAGIGSSATINGTLDESNKVVISSQAAAGFTINNATGTMTNNIINWTYTITDGASNTETCTSTWTKQ